MTDGGQVARVEVLTAEVRTLVVGSRQVTLSVYNQLDDVHPRDIEPFGRVSPKGAEYWKIHVVGRDEQGALVRAWTFSQRAISELRDGRSIKMVGYSVTPGRWRDSDDFDRQLFEETADQWSELPLIVLAGLR